MKKKIYLPLCLLVSLIFVGATPDDVVQRLKEALYGFNKKYPSEKLYIQTDKTYYKPGESIWYKGFLSNSTDNKPSSVSDVVYIELSDPWGNVVELHEQNIVNGTFDGAFRLSPDRQEGIYKITGYTAWMKNWGKEVFFSKEITVQKVITPRLLLKLDFEKRAYGAGDEVVANLKVTDLNNVKTTGSKVKSTVRIGGVEYKTLEAKSQDGKAVVRFSLPIDLDTADGILQIVVSEKGVEESISRSIPIVMNKIQLQFFPEGGEFIAGTENKVAFEALNEFGKGADVSGEVVDDRGNIITSFGSYHLGMGAFSFAPDKDRKYYARIITPAGNDELRELPAAMDTGYLLSLAEKDKHRLTWKIYCPTSNKLTLIAHTQGIIQYSKVLSLKAGENKVEVNTKDFPMGIAVFTLFDETKEVAERLVFLNQEKQLNIKLNTNKEYYEPEEKVRLSIETTDDKGAPVQANIGLSVVDEQLLTMADDKQDNLLSYMLLSSELKGKIQEPSFYFDPYEPKATESLDYLILTRGWRRFVWESLLSGAPPVEIKEMAEKLSSVYGYVLDKDGQPIQADVYLIEFGGRKRIAKLNTTREGHFVFHNVDIAEGIHVSTKLPNRVFLIKENPVVAVHDAGIYNTEEGGVVDLSKPSENIRKLPADTKETERFMSDQSVLEEVIVTGYGTERKSLYAGAVTTVVSNNMYDIQQTSDIASMLTGSVAGVMVTPQNGVAGSSPHIRVRGVSSINNTTNPIWIINGVLVEGDANEALSMVNPADINTIEVVNSPGAASIYGARAINGVILITTKKAYSRYWSQSPKPRYSGANLYKREFYKATKFTQTADNPDGNKTTVFWNGQIRTDANGLAWIEFINNKQPSTFRITAEGMAPANGLLASTSKRIVTQQVFSIDAKVPIFAGCGDRIEIPVMIKNMSNEPIVAQLSVGTSNPAAAILQEDAFMRDVEVAANMTQTAYITVIAGEETGEVDIAIHARSGEETNHITRQLHVRQINFPYQFSFSGRNMTDNVVFILPDHLNGTVQAEATAYVQLLDELFDGAEGIFREPHGCFEQLLSSAFPNVFALQLMKTTGKTNKAAEEKAMGYLETGYNKLANYETKNTGGFEWYGGSPAHEMLTAYGLVHFYELSKVYNKVDRAMTDRAVNFLLSKRNNDGGFKQNNGRYGFSGAPVNVNNAYIVYAFNEIERGDLVEAEYQSALKEAWKSQDIYRMALLANAAWHQQDMDSYRKLIAHFKEIADKKDLSKLNFEATIVYSSGESRNREAVAYWLMAILKNTNNFDFDLIDKCLNYISKGKSGYGFGNTQATSVCLQALTKYAIIAGSNMIGGNFCLDVNGDKECLDLKPDSEGGMKASIFFEDKLKKGDNLLSLSFEGSQSSFPYTVNISWFSALPPSSELCPLKLSTEIKTKEIKVNETVRLTVKLKNTESTGKPMSVAIIGIPGGMSLQPWQLKEMQEQEVFDFYEITNDNLVIYYRELGPAEEKTINLDLKAEIPGTYTATTSSAYIYYTDMYKHWIDGIKVTIKE